MDSAIGGKERSEKGEGGADKNRMVGATGTRMMHCTASKHAREALDSDHL